MNLGDLQSIYRKEKNSKTLQELPENYQDDFFNLIKNPQAKEFINDILEVYNEILIERKNKILRYCAGPSPEKNPENLQEWEVGFHKKIVSEIKKYLHTEIPTIEPGKTQENSNEQKDDDDFIHIEFIKPMPEIVGSDLKKYGPYKPGDKAKLPKTNSIILIKQEIAEKIIQ